MSAGARLLLYLVLPLLLGVSLCIGTSRLLSLYFASSSASARVVALQRAAMFSPWDWRYPKASGDWSRSLGAYRDAVAYYEKALSLDPMCASCWAGLAESQLALGMDPSSALENAVASGRSDTAVRTRSAVVYARMGRDDDAAREFAAALAGKREDKYEFFALLHRIYSESFILGSIIGDHEMKRYFAFARRKLEPQDTAMVWRRYREMNPSDTERRDYAAYLLGHGLGREAWRIVFGKDGPSPGTLLDASFESDGDLQRYRPFGWRIKEAPGVAVEIVAGDANCEACPRASKALRLAFDGEHNPEFFGVVQYLPLEPGASYHLGARVRSEDISSDSGPFLMVVGGDGVARDADCSLRVAAPQSRLTRDWEPRSLDFEVPRGCGAVRVMVARRNSNAVNNLIGGNFYIDDLHLTRR